MKGVPLKEKKSLREQAQRKGEIGEVMGGQATPEEKIITSAIALKGRKIEGRIYIEAGK